MEATQFHSYYHLHRPENPFDKNIISRADYNLTLDFLDSIATDSPLGIANLQKLIRDERFMPTLFAATGCWSIQINRPQTIATVRSLYWPGAVGFHVLETAQYGWFYNGTGRKNWDVSLQIFLIDRICFHPKHTVRSYTGAFYDSSDYSKGASFDSR